MRNFFAATILLTMVVVIASSGHTAGDAIRGESIFSKCEDCHIVRAKKNRLGPHLVGLFGRKAASVADYNYSEALKESGVKWDEITLDQYIKDPESYLQGTRMSFIGITKKEDRDDLIAYLKIVTTVK